MLGTHVLETLQRRLRYLNLPAACSWWYKTAHWWFHLAAHPTRSWKLSRCWLPWWIWIHHPDWPLDVWYLLSWHSARWQFETPNALIKYLVKYSNRSLEPPSRTFLWENMRSTRWHPCHCPPCHQHLHRHHHIAPGAAQLACPPIFQTYKLLWTNKRCSLMWYKDLIVLRSRKY